MTDTLQILEKVNSFYSNAFSQLITVTVAVLAFAGVFLPLLLQFLQWRTFRNERRSLQIQIIKEISSTKEALTGELQTRFEAAKQDFQKMVQAEIKTIQRRLNTEIAITRGGVCYVQAANYVMQGDVPHAASSFAFAADHSLKGDDDFNGQRALEELQKCLPRLTTASFEAELDLEEDLTSLVKTLGERNINGRFTDRIGVITRGIAAAKKRTS